jgi:hypothetical protein
MVLLIFNLFLLNHGENMNYYRVTVNDEELSYYVIEDTTHIYIKDVITSSIHNDAYLTKTLLEVPLGTIKVKVETFACINPTTKTTLHCKSFYEKGKTPTLKSIHNQNYTYQIFYEDEIIYEGEYLEDLSNIIQKKGQYYFIVKTNRQTSRKIKETTLLFSLKVG